MKTKCGSSAAEGLGPAGAGQGQPLGAREASSGGFSRDKAGGKDNNPATNSSTAEEEPPGQPQLSPDIQEFHRLKFFFFVCVHF